jgi:hypothetical protein
MARSGVVAGVAGVREISGWKHSIIERLRLQRQAFRRWGQISEQDQGGYGAFPVHACAGFLVPFLQKGVRKNIRTHTRAYCWPTGRLKDVQGVGFARRCSSRAAAWNAFGARLWFGLTVRP